MRYVIVGGGIAGTTAAGELRRLDQKAEIILISEEQHPVYSRVLLPLVLVGKAQREKVFLKKEEWYQQQNIEWLRGIRADKLDTKNKFVYLSDDRELPYDKLLITTGGEIRPIGHDMRGVSYMRTLDDIDHLIQIIAQLPAGAKAGIYGGGFIACEYLDYFEYLQMPITIAMRGKHFWSRVLDEESGQMISEHLKNKGIEVITEASLEGLSGGLELDGFVTTKGKFECDVLGIGIGLTSDSGWLEDAGIELGFAVKTNKFLETNITDVYAAGDITEFDDVVVGRQRQVGTWLNSIQQAKTAALNMTGKKKEYRLISSYATSVLGLEVIFIGDVSRSDADQIILRTGKEGIGQLFIRDNKIVGATLVNRNTDRMPITRLIDKGKDVSSNLEKLQDGEVEIEEEG